MPFAFLLVARRQAVGSGQAFVKALLIVLLVARVLHPFGMFARKNSTQQYACRGGGIHATLTGTAATAVGLLLRTV